MKYPTVTILFVLVISINAFAQSDSSRSENLKHLIGFSVGFTTTRLSGNELDFMFNSVVSGKNSHQESKPGIDLALHYQYALTKNYFLKSGLAIVSKKNEFKDGPAFPFHSYLTYMSLPALAGIDLGGGKTNKLSVLIETGLVGNIVVGSDHITEHWTQTVSTHIKSFVPSYAAGASISYKAKNQYRFFVAWRLTKDLTDVYERVHDYENTDGERIIEKYHYRTTSNHFTLGFYLPAKSKFSE